MADPLTNRVPSNNVGRLVSVAIAIAALGITSVVVGLVSAMAVCDQFVGWVERTTAAVVCFPCCSRGGNLGGSPAVPGAASPPLPALAIPAGGLPPGAVVEVRFPDGTAASATVQPDTKAGDVLEFSAPRAPRAPLETGGTARRGKAKEPRGSSLDRSSGISGGHYVEDV